MTNKKIFRFIIIILWLMVIFSFSNQQGTVSNKKSEDIAVAVVNVVSNENNNKNNEKFIKKYNFLVRKIAHFLEFFILAILIERFISLFQTKNKIIICILLCLLVAIGDEFHQSFIPLRDCNINDVLIDLSGTIFGLGLYVKLNKKVRK